MKYIMKYEKKKRMKRMKKKRSFHSIIRQKLFQKVF